MSSNVSFHVLGTVIVWIVAFCGLCNCETRDSYLKLRGKILKAEDSWRTGGISYLSAKEIRVNQKIMAQKEAELNQSFISQLFPPSLHFFKAKPMIENSTVFKIIQQMPKGAALHLHDSSLVDVWWLVKNATYRDHCYMCVDQKSQLRFKFSPSTPKPEFCQWLLTSDERKKYDSDTFDQWLFNNMSLIVSDPATAYPNTLVAWKKFASLFKAADGLIFYKPVFEAYFKEALTEFYKDNVQYFEFRALLTDVKDLSGNLYDREWMINTYRNISAQFVREHPDFVGTKMIYSTSRSASKSDVGKAVNVSLEFQQKFPDYFVGFDLVGQEDKGHTLLYFLDELLYPSQTNRSLKYFFHAGETDWLGSDIDENLVDAILLNTSRIGHGYALSKHPTVMKYIKERDIAIEVCPISNQVLKLVDDLRNHPASSLLMQGYPVVISPDDPGLWGARGLSYDFYQAFMGLGGDKADLAFLKQLAMDSISYSAMNTPEKEHAKTIWMKKWDQFLDYVLDHY